MSGARKVLVVGAGGREHALALRLLESPSVSEVSVTPGNAGTAQPPPDYAHKILGNAAGDPLELAKARGIDLVVIGPEAPLAAGLVDRLTEAGFLVFGPTRRAAQLEASKSFMKDFATRHGIKTARYVVVRSAAEAEVAIRQFEHVPVVKADGLCSGKGVVLPTTHAEALLVAKRMLSGELFGEAGRIVVIEERLHGVEVSLHAISDGESPFVLPPAQDHKRIGDGDTGPNTGGMGTYAPAPVADPELLTQFGRDVLEGAVRGMKQDGIEYRGTLFANLMITPAGEPFLLEYNVRFGDPETQVLMNVIGGDFGDALEAAARGNLARDALTVTGDHALCVVLAAAGYPEAPRQGDVITGLELAEKINDVRVYHAGTKRDQGRLVVSGGRVVGVTARANTLEHARDVAYQAAGVIHFEGRQLRHDIGARVLGSSAR